jgi:hypothetical protein
MELKWPLRLEYVHVAAPTVYIWLLSLATRPLRARLIIKPSYPICLRAIGGSAGLGKAPRLGAGWHRPQWRKRSGSRAREVRTPASSVSLVPGQRFLFSSQLHHHLLATASHDNINSHPSLIASCVLFYCLPFLLVLPVITTPLSTPFAWALAASLWVAFPLPESHPQNQSSAITAAT